MAKASAAAKIIRLSIVTYTFTQFCALRKSGYQENRQSALLRSRRAIERLCAKLDGTLRSHQLAANRTLRDTCAYRIIGSEWSTARTYLTRQSTRPRDVS
jgi:hypothetical protein